MYGTEEPIGEWTRGKEWERCLISWQKFMNECLFSFPTFAHTLYNCSRRDSTHEGDRINSILGLAGVQGFDAHKDDNVEESTMKLFKGMGNNGLALALFTTNESSPPSKAITSIHQHTWLPSLSGPLVIDPQEGEPNFHTDNILFEVLEDGNIELKGLLAFVDVQFNVVPYKEVPYEKKTAGSSTHSDTLKDQANLPSAEDRRLHVDIRDHYKGPYFYEASLPGASFSEMTLGLMFIPALDLDSIHHIFQQGLMHHATMRQFLEKHHIFQLMQDGTMRQFSEEQRMTLTALGFNEQYTEWELEIQNILEKRRMPTGGERMLSFCASLLFPAKVLELDIESDFPAIVVQGDINSPRRHQLTSSKDWLLFGD